VLRNRLYYGVKPLIPSAIRLAIRRWVVVRKRQRVTDIWPIKPGTEKPPQNWPGWPGHKKFALVFTHDVEGPKGLSRCRQLMDLEQKAGFRSSFNFIPEGDYDTPAELREELCRNGFEVGVHDLKHDGKLYFSKKDFTEFARRINQYCRDWKAVGFRSGFMLRNLEWIHQLDVLYDASTFDTDPFEPQPDGADTIFPFWVRNDAGGGYVELPYTLPQDSTLYLLLQEKNPGIWLQKLDWIAKHGGMALVNVHPDYLSFEKNSSDRLTFPAALYSEFLTAVKNRYAGEYWHALPREVAEHFKQTLHLETVPGGHAK